jgi:crotonobetainyl-CoA:carnitine CoA-transferase CaiB-like acyl-CoA transferase
MAGPLEGYRVVEIAEGVAGPYCAMELGDAGADVIKVESRIGDRARGWGPPLQGDDSPVFLSLNRNKRSIALDLTTEAGLVQLHHLLDQADVLITNWRPGVAEAFGLTSESVVDRWPRLVWVRVSGYGQTGPMSKLPAFDSISQARVGFAAANGTEPMLVPTYVADKVTATYVAQSALAAIVQRTTTGRGCVVDVSMLDAMAYFDSPDLLAGHQTPERTDDRVLRMLQAPRPLPTADGWIVLAPVSGKQVKRAMIAAGLEQALADMRSQPDPLAASERFFELLGDHLRSRTTEEWTATFSEADVPASAVMSVAEHIADEQVVHNQMYRIVDDPALGKARRPRHPALFDAAPVDTDDLACPPLNSFVGEIRSS